MQTFLIILTALVFIKLVLVAAMRPVHSNLSLFELNRRSELGDDKARKLLTREKLLGDVQSLQSVAVATLLIAFTLLSVSAFGWLVGILMSLFVALEYGAIARIKPVRQIARKIYQMIDDGLIKFVRKIPVVFALLRSASAADDSTQHIDSRAELQQLIDDSRGVLSDDEKSLVVHCLSFGDELVRDHMTPRSMIDSIKSTEFLGPLTLDELHKAGHSRLPVIRGDIDHIVGILNLKSLLALDIKRSTTAEKAMDANVYYIRADQTLQYALAAFLRTKHQLFVVVNEFRETVGLLALEDVIESLIGRKIVDEFDEHSDLRKVALRNPRHNNQPQNSENV